MQKAHQPNAMARRQFLSLVAGGLGAAVASGGLSANPPMTAGTRKSGWGLNPSADSLRRATGLLNSNTAVDFHTHLGLWQTMGLTAAEAPMGRLSRQKLESNLREYLAAGVNCVYMDCISDILRTRIGVPGNKDRDFIGDEAWQDYLRQYELMQELLGVMPLEIAESNRDVERIAKSGKLAVIFSSEGAHMIEGQVARLELMQAHGLRRLQPLHYLASELGDLQTDPPRFNGLSALGREAVSLASELGILLDMAHATEAVVEQTAALTGRPLALSHTMVAYNSERFGDYRNSRARWVTPAHARLIADTGGVLGTFPIPAPWGVDSAAAFVEALQVMVDTVGIDHVAWSTDLMDIGRPKFLQDYRDFPGLCAMLLDAGFSDDDLLKLVGGNALRVQESASLPRPVA
ncbi:MAG: dipeptidase [Congregibacter sp.]